MILNRLTHQVESKLIREQAGFRSRKLCPGQVLKLNDNFKNIESKFTNTLNKVEEYYKNNSLRPNLAKTEIYVFHLKDKKAKQKLLIQWNGIELKNNQNPKYLGVT